MQRIMVKAEDISQSKQESIPIQETQCQEKAQDGETITPEDKWQIRDCDVYKDEYDECTSFRARFHQYFIFGNTIDCNQWKKDYDNCCKYRDEDDWKAAEAVIKSEKTRRLERFRSHFRNNVWTTRDSPPEDWAAPLPEWMVKRDENTYLAHKAKELREGISVEESSGFCSIM